MKSKICVMMIFALVGLALATGCTNSNPEPGDMIPCSSLVTVVAKYEVPLEFFFREEPFVQRYIKTSDGREHPVAIAPPYGIENQNLLWESIPIGVPGIIETGIGGDMVYAFTPINVTHSRPYCADCCEVAP